MSLQASATTLLADWQPDDADQQDLRVDFLAHLAQYPNGWSRTCLPDHLTASVIVLDQTQRQVLLGLHRKVGLWLQFGGHIESPDRSVAAAAHREAIEESGVTDLRMVLPHPLQLDRHRAPCSPAARHHLDVQFLAVAAPGATPTTSVESVAVEWFDLDHLPAQTDEAVHRLVAAARRL